MAPIVEVIKGIAPTQLGEAPHWDIKSQTLYFVDIFGKTIHKYVPSTKEHTSVTLDGTVSFVIPVKDQKNKFAASQGNKIVVVTWDGVSKKVSDIQILGEVDDSTHRVNDGKADPTGRLWTGAWRDVGEEVSSFVSVQKGKLTTHLTKVGISNGLAFNVELKKFYYIDSGKGTVDQFDIDLEKGTISNRKVIFTLQDHDIPGFPDGMTIDAEGNLWVAIFNGSRVIKIDPRKPETLLQTVSFPAQEITSVAFGGANLDELYVTSGKVELGEYDYSFTEADGLLYKVTGLGAKGLPADDVVL